MITKEIALTLRYGQELLHSTATNKDGTALRARVNGKCKTWVTRPDDFKLPMKYGLKHCFYIGPFGPDSARNWSLPDRWPIERFWKEPT